jgi:hypothetical protein
MPCGPERAPLRKQMRSRVHNRQLGTTCVAQSTSLNRCLIESNNLQDAPEIWEGCVFWGVFVAAVNANDEMWRKGNRSLTAEAAKELNSFFGNWMRLVHPCHSTFPKRKDVPIGQELTINLLFVFSRVPLQPFGESILHALWSSQFRRRVSQERGAVARRLAGSLENRPVWPGDGDDRNRQSHRPRLGAG